MRGKQVLVTGATSGIGKEAALQLARAGASLTLVSRDKARGEAVAEELRRAAPGAVLDVLTVDLASQAQIRRAAVEFKGRHPRLDVLINNAGVAPWRRELTEDGLERQFAVNHLAYFLLTTLLIAPLEAAGSARVVNVSSQAHQGARLRFEDLQAERSYNPWTAYGQSKLANLLFSNELARRFAGKGICSNCLHPGSVRTGIFRDLPKVAQWAISPFLSSVEQGASTTVYLASAPELDGVTGRYFVRGKEVRPSTAAVDPELARRLWEVSEALTSRSAKREA